MRWQRCVNGLLLTAGAELTWTGDAAWNDARQARLTGMRLLPGALTTPLAKLTDDMLAVDLEKLYEASLERCGVPDLDLDGAEEIVAGEVVDAGAPEQEGVPF